MQTHKSPGRELAEKMWFDVTGRVPSATRDAPGTPSTAEPAAHAPVLASFPDLNQAPELEAESSGGETLLGAELSPATIGTFAAAVVLGGLILWVTLFAHQERSSEPSASPPDLQLTRLNTTPVGDNVSLKDRSLSNSLPNNSEPPTTTSEGDRVAAAKARLPVPSFSAAPSSEGWSMGGSQPSHPGTEGLVGSAPWSMRSAAVTPNHAEAEALLIGKETAAEGPVARGEFLPSQNPRVEGSYRPKVARSEPANFGNTLPPTPTPDSSWTSASPTTMGREALPSQSLSPSALLAEDSKVTAAFGNSSTSPGSASQGAITGLAWLRGEKEFASRSFPGQISSGDTAEHFGFRTALMPGPIADANAMSNQSQGGTGPLVGASQTVGAPPIGSEASFYGPAASGPTASVAQVPKSGDLQVPGSPIVPTNTLPRPQEGYYSSSKAGPGSSDPPATYHPTAVTGTVNPSQTIINPTVINPTVVSNPSSVVGPPTVIPAGAWQAIDASSFRWGQGAWGASGPATYPDPGVQSALLAPQPGPGGTPMMGPAAVPGSSTPGAPLSTNAPVSTNLPFGYGPPVGGSYPVGAGVAGYPPTRPGNQTVVTPPAGAITPAWGAPPNTSLNLYR